MATRGLTDIAVRNLKPKVTRYEVPDPGARGLYVVVQPSGKRGYCVRFRFAGTPRKLTLTGGVSLAAARRIAADTMYEVAQGRDPAAAKQDAKEKAKQNAATAASGTLKAICESYMHREGGKLRSSAERAKVLERTVYPELGDRQIDTIKRSEIVKLLDAIEDVRGSVAADMTLAILRKIMNWHAARDDDFRSPIIRGMARSKPKERARSRILSDDELQRLWAATGATEEPFAALIRFLLLTAARRTEAARMTWVEIDGTDWTLPAARNKAKVDLVRPLSKAALAVLATLPRFDGCTYAFTNDGRRAIANFGKRALDQTSGVRDWRLHDLRRTARSLMSRAGVDSDHAERCLGHVIGGVRGTYDRFRYEPQMRAAYEALAAQIERIVDPQPNVVPLRKADA